MARFGEIGKQYPDDEGRPLISGKLYFYDSGTTTFKDTFADVNLSIPNSNPVILTAAGRQPNVFFNGSARVVLTKSDDTQIEVRDPEGGDTSGQFQDWNSITIYGTADIVVASNDRYYQSIGNGNLGNDPTSSPAEWAEVEFLGVWNSVVVYALNATVKGSDGLFYRSLVGSNTGNDPISSPTQWGSPIDVNFNPVAPYSEALEAVTASDIDAAEGNYFTKTLAANTTFTFSNPLTNASFFTARIKNAVTGGFTVTWPASVTLWKGGVVPTLGDDDLLVFVTEDAGTSYYGVHIGEVSAP